MIHHTEISNNDLGSLAEDARALMVATADVAGEKVAEARRRLAFALDRAKKMAGRVRDQAVDCAEATDQAAREHPYRAIGFAFGVGALLGYFVMRRGSRNG